MTTKTLSILILFGQIVAFGIDLAGQDKKGSKKAPAIFQAKFETTAGDFVIEVHREWAPVGADRFYTLVSSGFYDDCKFFRVMRGFMAQTGINGDPQVNSKWMKSNMKDDPVMKSNRRGFVTFAKAPIPNSRTTQFFINFSNNSGPPPNLDSTGFAPFGQVVEGMDSVDSIYDGYGDKIDQQMVIQRGNKFLNAEFPKLTTIKRATIVEKE